MRAVIQRVSHASVSVDNIITGCISKGLLVMICAETADTESTADRLLAKLLKLRVFGDEAGKMNRSIQAVEGGLLIISQFTLAATLTSWLEPIVRMWRFSKSNGITEGFHTKMEMISRRAYGFRNFENYRLRVLALCGWDGVINRV